MAALRRKGPTLPRDYCVEPQVFGNVRAAHRTWRVPAPSNDPVVMIDFSRAVVQHAISISLKRYKNTESLVQEELVGRDWRPDSLDNWQRALNGRKWLTTRDAALIYSYFPHAWPNPMFVRRLLFGASGGLIQAWGTAPLGGDPWTEVDSSLGSPSNDRVRDGDRR